MKRHKNFFLACRPLQLSQTLIGILLVFIMSVNTAIANPAALTPWKLSAGIMQLTVPRYQGADAYRVLIVPNFDLKYKKSFFINAYQGIGVNIINTKKWRIGSSLRYNFGGNDERSSRFAGLDDINDTFQAGAYATYRWSLFSFSLNTYRALGALRGSGYYSPSIGLFIPFFKPFFLRTSISARFDDQSYMQNLFGVDRQEAARSGLKEYNTTAGWQNITFSLIPIWAINKKWSLSGVFSVKRFVGQAAKSPIVDNTTTLFAGISVMYQLL